MAVTQMRGRGRFYDPRMNDPAKFPIAVRTGEWNVDIEPDLVSGKLPDHHEYQPSPAAPTPPAGSFNAAAAERGAALFSGKAGCAVCHVPPTYSEPGYSLHAAEEIGIDDFHAMRSPTGLYRTTPLPGLFSMTKGGFYHDGRFSDLPSVVNHYDNRFDLSLSGDEKNDLVEFLKSL